MFKKIQSMEKYMGFKKKSLAVTITAILAVGLTACGGSSSNDNDDPITDGNGGGTTHDTSAVSQGVSSTITAINTTPTHKGAFASSEHTGNVPNATAWTKDWTVGIHGNATVWQPQAGASANGKCVEGTTFAETLTVATGVQMDLCTLPARITSDTHLSNLNVYITAEDTPGTKVGNGDKNTDRSYSNVKLTIDKGTLILAGDGEALTITRGSSISAIGTKEDPIVMASYKWFKDQTIDERGTWGGLVLMGQAKEGRCADANYAACNVLAEGGVGYYGGNNDADNSGELQYVVIRGAGYDLDGQGNELNALTMMATGSATKVSYVQVHKTVDDGIEHFGATNFMHHIVMTDIGDDAFDWGHGFTGSAQYGYVKMSDSYKVDDSRGIEGDNSKGTAGDGTKTIFPGHAGAGDTPISNPTLRNFTLLGDMTWSDSGILLRRGTQAEMSHMVVDGFKDECVEIRDRGTVEDTTAQDATTGSLTFSSTYERIKLDNSEFGTCGDGTRTVDFTDAKDDKVAGNNFADKSAAETAWINAQEGNINLIK